MSEVTPVAEPQTSTTTAETKDAEQDEASLSNKELKELKKKEKAAKRSAQKQANGITIEQQQQAAQVKREKKSNQREKQLKSIQDANNKKNRNIDNNNENNGNGRLNFKKSILFGHLETAEERKASILALTSAVVSPRASRITSSGLMVPVVADILYGPSSTPTASTLLSTPSQNDTNIESAETSKQPAGIPTPISVPFLIESEEYSVIPGIASVIPSAMNTSFSNSQSTSSVKELLLNKDFIHPAISLLTSDLAHYKIVGSIPRCIAMLEAFQIVISDYKTPKGTTLSRNLTNYLSHQINLLKKARPLSVTMGNAIRWIKQEISLIEPSMSDEVAKEDLCNKIAQFAREKIELADQLIIEITSNHIENGNTILTYGSSKVIFELLLHNAIDLQKDIKVVIVDSRPLFEGRKMAKALRERGINTMYVSLTSLDTVFRMNVDYVILGAHSILSNGFLYSRSGTAMVAMTAKRRNVPVLVCCESLKFSRRVQLDSVTFNELADPNDLVGIEYGNPVERRGNKGSLLEQFVKERNIEKEGELKRSDLKNKNKNNKGENSSGGTGSGSKSRTANVEKEINEAKGKGNILDGWETEPHLNILNVLYDLTPPEYIKKVITEFGALPPSSVPVILREYKGSV